MQTFFRTVFPTILLCLSLGIHTAGYSADGKTAKNPEKKLTAHGYVLASGVEVHTVVEGKGARPKADSVVKVHYRGTLDNGKEFDSSYKRGEPATFPLSAVIPCWTQAVATMAVGGKAMLVCPAETAYGARGSGASVPPNSRLKFEVELLDILK